MRYGVFVAALAAGSAASAHPGHLAEAAGHGHWLGAAAVGAAVAIGLWAALKGRKAADGPARAGKEPAEEELQEA